MTEETDQEREIRELRERLARLEANAAPPTPPPPPQYPPSYFDPATMKPKGMSPLAIGCLGAVAIPVILIAIAMCSTPARIDTTPAGPNTLPEPFQVNSANPSAGHSPDAAWSYTEAPDAMRHTTDKTACVLSTNELHQEFPYHDQRVQLCVRRSARFGTDVYVAMVDEGQFLCHSFDPCRVNVTFDGGAVQRYSGSDSADGSSNVFFLSGAQNFIRRASNAHRIMVEVDVYRSGRQQLTFQVAEPLRWP